MDPGKTYVNQGQEDQMEIIGYRLHRGKRAFTWICYALTLGLLRLLHYWLPQLELLFSYSTCRLAEAERVFLVDLFKKTFVAQVRHTTCEGTRVKIRRPKKHAFQRMQQEMIGAENDESLIPFFECKKVKYIWDLKRQLFVPLRGMEVGYKIGYFHNLDGLSPREQARKRVLYGVNSIDLHVTPITVLIVKQILSPFYIFQLFSMIVWYIDEYEIYASCIVVITVVSISVTIYQTRKFERALRNTITSSTLCTVCRGEDSYENVASEDLVPGDIIEIPRHGCSMKCDAVLIAGNCIVNESMLTGESVPVTKIPLTPTHGIPDEAMPELNLRQHSRNILFCGTDVIQTRFYGSKRVRAVVIRTGFATSKGELVRSILYPKPVDFKFERDSYYFVACLAMLACLGFIYTIVLMVQNGDVVGDIILRSLDLITITVPPSLPAALAIGVVFSQQRLKTKNVYCISPKGITICGTINSVCFDKTGTLTEDNMDIHGAVPVEKGSFGLLQKKLSEESTGPFLAAMTTCHSLTIIDGKIMGDPLDLIMFKATNWDLIEPGPDETRFDVMTPTVVKPKISEPLPNQGGDLSVIGEDIGIVRQFPFSSSLQRMSVVSRKLGAQNFELYVKGSPETISSLSKPETVPFNFHSILQSYTQQGYRVIALAWKPLASKLTYVKVHRLQRESIENDLTFLGLLVMENRLKPQSAPVIDQLREANIRTVMVTGDNMLTALSVARACRMVDRTDRTILVQAYPPTHEKQDVTLEFVYANNREETVMEIISKDNNELQMDDESQRYHFALTGKTWGIIRKHCPEILERIVVKGSVFARMAPDQKAQLIEVMQDVGYYVGMCGDGANDCGALKAAHMGISLSEAEASVASPFTSKTPTIECVPRVIKEGRAALVTSFGIFKYIACYSLTQFTSVLILYWIGANLTDGEFLYIDLFVITSFSITFSRTGAYDELVKERPYVSLFSLSPLLSIVTQMAMVMAAQAFVYLNVKEQPWFLPFIDNDENDYKCYENFAVFILSAYQYIILGITFSKGAPFRKSLFSNWWFLFNILVAFGATMWVNLYPPDVLTDFMELKLFPSMEYRAIFIGVAGICFSTSYITEKMIVDNDSIRTRITGRIKSCMPSTEPKYHTVETEIVRDADWPPVSEDTVDLAEIFQRLDSVDQPPKIPTARQSSMEDIPEASLNDSKGSSELAFNVADLEATLEGFTEGGDIPSVEVVSSKTTTPDSTRKLQDNTFL